MAKRSGGRRSNSIRFEGFLSMLVVFLSIMQAFSMSFIIVPAVGSVSLISIPAIPCLIFSIFIGMLGGSCIVAGKPLLINVYKVLVFFNEFPVGFGAFETFSSANNLESSCYYLTYDVSNLNCYPSFVLWFAFVTAILTVPITGVVLFYMRKLEHRIKGEKIVINGPIGGFKQKNIVTYRINEMRNITVTPADALDPLQQAVPEAQPAVPPVIVQVQPVSEDAVPVTSWDEPSTTNDESEIMTRPEMMPFQKEPGQGLNFASTSQHSPYPVMDSPMPSSVYGSVNNTL